jgi:hypothetical protein
MENKENNNSGDKLLEEQSKECKESKEEQLRTTISVSVYAPRLSISKPTKNMTEVQQILIKSESIIFIFLF